MVMLILSTTILSFAGTEIAHAVTTNTNIKVAKTSKSSIDKVIKDWEIDTSIPGKIKLISYNGHDKDVVLPTGDDLTLGGGGQLMIVCWHNMVL